MGLHACLGEQEVPWATVDPYPSSEEEEQASRAAHPEYWAPQLPPPLEVDLGPGEVPFQVLTRVSNRLEVQHACQCCHAPICPIPVPEQHLY